MDKKYVIALCAAYAFVGLLAIIVSYNIGHSNGYEEGDSAGFEFAKNRYFTGTRLIDACATIPADQLKEAARITTAEIKEANAKADSLNARKTVILAVQDANQ